MINKESLQRLRKRYPPGTQVELIRMNDPYTKKPAPGDKGVVTGVDDIGTIHVNWECRSALGVAYLEDKVRVADESVNTMTTYHQENNPDRLTVFNVNEIWLEKTLRDTFDTTIEDFYGDYTYDDSEIIYRLAKEEDVIILEYSIFK